MSHEPESGATYEAAGVSIDAGDRAVELMKVWIDKARRPEMLGGIGGFAGLFDATALKAFDHPLLATSADGVGTKVAIAQAMDVHHTIGFDLVGMLVDDIVVCGAEPLFLTDYIATGRVVPGDAVIAMRSSGLHSNGYSLVRHVLLNPEAGAGWSLERHVDELG